MPFSSESIDDRKKGYPKMLSASISWALHIIFIMMTSQKDHAPVKRNTALCMEWHFGINARIVAFYDAQNVFGL